MKSFATKHAAILALTLGLAGCGGGGTAESPETLSGSVTMVTGRAYTVEEGDTIEKSSADTVVRITSDLQSGETTATLLSGGARLVRP